MVAQTQIERRVFGPTEIRVKREEGSPPRIVGHAAIFNALSEDLGGFREEIARGAFRESVKDDDIRALFNHNPNKVLGRNTAGTLIVREDRDGLLVDIDPPQAQWAQDLLESIERGDITGMSFAFRTNEGDDEWNTRDGVQVRRLKRVRLFDVSPVTYPAYPDTDVAVRSLQLWQQHRGDAITQGRCRLRLAEMG
jgi:HK97 family phage prohead protease